MIRSLAPNLCAFFFLGSKFVCSLPLQLQLIGWQDGSTVPNRTIRGNKTPLPLKLSPSMSSEHLLNLNKLIA